MGLREAGCTGEGAQGPQGETDVSAHSVGVSEGRGWPSACEAPAPRVWTRSSCKASVLHLGT